MQRRDAVVLIILALVTPFALVSIYFDRILIVDPLFMFQSYREKIVIIFRQLSSLFEIISTFFLAKKQLIVPSKIVNLQTVEYFDRKASFSFNLDSIYFYPV